MAESKGKSLPKMYGNPNFSTGPRRQSGDQAMSSGNQASGTMKSGPGPTDASIGRKTGSASVGGGTKGDQAGEDSGGKAGGRKGKKGY
jgi:hypothetical protein